MTLRRAFCPRIVVRVLILVFVLLACGPAQAKDELVFGIRQFPPTLHPLITASVAKSYILGMAARPVTAHDQSWSLVCIACAALPTLQADSATGASMKVSLKPDLYWGDGTPVTSRDVLFTWRVGRHPESGVGEAELFRRIERIDVIDDHTTIFHLNRLTFDFADLNGFVLLPEHIEGAPFEADPREYRNRTTYATRPTEPGLYWGPYVVTEVVPGARVALERNPHWKGRPPEARRVVLRVIEDTSALVANLLAGGIDLIPGEMGIAIDQAASLEKSFPGRFNVTYKPALRLEHIDFNLDNPILADVKVRRALAQATDRQGIVDGLFEGKNIVAETLVSPLDGVFSNETRRYPFDPTEASRLLDEAGWLRSGAGVRRNAAGETLALEINSTAGDRTRDLVLQTLQSQWRAGGIDLRIKNYQAQTLFGEILFKRRFPALGLYTNVTSPGWVPRTILHSAHIPDVANNWSGYNLSGYRNPEMDGVIERLEVERDAGTRRDLWRRLQQIYAEDLPALPLYFQSTAHVLPLWLKGMEPTGHNSFSTLWIETWKLDPAPSRDAQPAILR